MVRFQSTHRAALMLLGALLIAGCMKRPSRGEAAAAASRRVTIEVENNHWATVVVYAVVNGQNMRMGDVYTGTTASLRTPVGIDPSVVDFRIRVDPIGAREVFTSVAIKIHNSNRVLLTVENDIRFSRIVIG